MAEGFKIADAFVEVHADASRVDRDVQGALRNVDVDGESDRMGRRMGSGIGRGLLASIGGGGGGGGLVGTTIGVMATKFGVLTVAGAALGSVLQPLVGLVGLLPAAGIAGGLAMGTLAVATSGFGDAMKNAGDPAAFADSIGKLSPNAQAAATSLRDLIPAWGSLKTAVQDQFFAGLGGMFTRLAGQYLPMLQTSMASVASGVNGMIRGVGAEFAEAGRQADMRMILTASAGTVNNLLAAVRPLVSAFLDVAAVAAPMLQQLTFGAGEAATKFAEFVTKARESGQLGEWIQTGLQAFRDLWTIVSLLTGTVTALVQAFGGPDSLIGTLTLVATALNTVATFIRDNIAWLGPLALAIGVVSAAVKVWAIAQAAINAILMINPFVALAVAIIAIVALIVMNWDKIKAFLTATWEAIKTNVSTQWNAIKENISSILNAIGAYFTAKWNEIKAFLSSAWESIKSAASTVWNGIKATVQNAVDGIKNILNWFGNLGSMFSNWFTSAKNAASNALTSLVSWVSGLPGRILSALGNLGSTLFNSGRSLITGLWNGISSAIGGVISKISSAVGRIRNLFPFSPAKEGPFSGTGYTSFSGAAMMKDWAKGMVSQSGTVQDALRGVMGDLQPQLGLSASGFGSGAGGGAAMPAAVAAGSSVTIANLTLQIAGNLDPMNPVAWQQAMENIQSGLRNTERMYS